MFAGAGGLSEGFIRAGFKPVAHVEMEPAACFTLKTRLAFHYLKSNDQLGIYCSYLKGEISRSKMYDHVPSDLLDSVINMSISPENNEIIFRLISEKLDGKNVDLIIGGPPCQAYSVVGRARSDDGMESDPRNHLYIQYAKYLEQFMPRMFVFENVLGLKSAKEGAYLEKMEKLFDKKGYKMKLFTVAANNFGVLQNRKRVIILGYRKDFSKDLPDLEAIQLPLDFKVSDIFIDLPPMAAGEGIDKYACYTDQQNEYLSLSLIRNGLEILTQHITRPLNDQDKEIYRIAVEKWNDKKERLDYNDLPESLKSHSNRHSFFDRFKVVASDLNYSQTVVAHIAKDGHYYIHPDIRQNRSISVREAARLQSFPDDYYFEGLVEGHNRTSAFSQIGNAVPPLMAQVIAKKLIELF